MGSNMKPTIFNERVANALRNWHQTARKRLKENRRSGSVTPLSPSTPTTPTRGLSPVHLLHRYKSAMDSLQTSPRQYFINDVQFDPNGRFPSSPSHHAIRVSAFHHGEQGPVDGGREMQELGGSTEQQLPHEIDSDNGTSHVFIDFSFDKRRRFSQGEVVRSFPPMHDE